VDETFFDYLEGLRREHVQAKRGICPRARKCHTREELADWFMLMAVACRGIRES
jgi:hypothetical protein